MQGENALYRVRDEEGGNRLMEGTMKKKLSNEIVSGLRDIAS
jgi:hypothetical protein